MLVNKNRKKEKTGGSENSDNLPHGKVSVVKIKQPKYKEITPGFMKGEDEKRHDEKRHDEKGESMRKQLTFFSKKIQILNSIT